MPPRAAPSLRITTSWLTMTLPTPEAALLVGRTRLKFLRHGADEAQGGVVLAQRAFYGSPRVVPELLSKVVDGASGGDLILPDSVDEFHIFNDLSQAAVAL